MRRDTLSTRKRIIDTAERLFAERGVANTSLLEIARAAGQKNRSALQYHFTNKEGLLDAVLDKHALRIAERRQQMLDELQRQDSFSFRQLIEALVIPMASQLDDADGGRAFLKIHSQLMSSGAYGELRQRRDRELDDTRQLLAMAAPFIDEAADERVRARLLLTGCLLIHGLATYLDQTDRIAREAFLDTLIQGIVDLLQQSPD